MMMKSLIFIKIAFILFGGLFTIFGILHYQKTDQFLANATHTNGTVIELTSYRDDEGTIMYRPIVQFYDHAGNMVVFSSSNASHPPAYRIDETVKVAYNPDNSSDAKLVNFMALWFMPLMFTAMGSLFVLIGLFLLCLKRPPHKYTKELQQNGIAIQAAINGVEPNPDYSKGGRHPYIIYAQWQNPHTKKIHLFESAAIWYDPSDYIKYKTITVFIDPDNPQAYYMDTSFLPELAKE